MAFVVETGAVVANANAYMTDVEFTSFHEDRMVSVGDWTATEQQAAIIRATDYLDKRFGTKFRGFKKDSNQTLQWPRLDVDDDSGYRVDSDVIPAHLKNACAEYALLALRLGPLLPVPNPNFSKIEDDGSVTKVAGGAIARTFEKVGPLEEEAWYHDPSKLERMRAGGVLSPVSSSINLPEYPVADEWLKQLIIAGFPTTLARA
jgi:hypothetical protein